MKKTVLITGASSGIGLAIAKDLSKDYEVYGIARNFPESVPFHVISCDITKTDELLKAVREVPDVYILINCAGCAYFCMHEELNAQKIQTMVRTDFEAPMILTQALLRELKKQKGYVINICSVAALEPAPHGAAYGAVKAGLLSFSNSLFAENRKYGLHVTAICPDLTAETEFYRNADFMTSEEPGSYLLPADMVQAVRYVLNQREGVNIPQIVLRPSLNRIVRKSIAKR